MKHILAAVDGSEPSFRALDFAVDLASRTGTKLYLLIVREFIVGRKDTFPVLDNTELKTLQDRAEKVAKAAGLKNVATLTPKSRDAAYTIVDTAIEQKADLIVMGASGKSTVKAMLLGSVSNEVLRKAHCPVTIVH